MREEWSCVYQGFGGQFVTIDGMKRAQRLSVILLGYLEVNAWQTIFTWLCKYRTVKLIELLIDVEIIIRIIYYYNDLNRNV